MSKQIKVQDLLDAGVHFGHKTSRWNPKMAPYIYGRKDDVHVIDVRQTAVLMEKALDVIRDTVKKNGKILFVSTKVQASSIIAEYVAKCGQYYVHHRWLGGMLTNWKTISASIKRLDELEDVLENEEACAGYTKKEILDMTRNKDKLLRSLGGIRKLESKPDLLVVIDTNKEHLAIKEAVKLGVRIVAVVDTNSNPDNIDYPIPGNDDAIRSIRFYCDAFANAALRGLEESMRDSGVDLGAMSSLGEDNKSSMQEIIKLKTTKKISKTQDISEKENADFEHLLTTNTKDASLNQGEDK